MSGHFNLRKRVEFADICSGKACWNVILRTAVWPPRVKWMRTQRINCWCIPLPISSPWARWPVSCCTRALWLPKPMNGKAGVLVLFISSSAVFEKCLAVIPNGNVCYQLKMLYKDDATHVIFNVLDFITMFLIGLYVVTGTQILNKGGPTL